MSDRVVLPSADDWLRLAPKQERSRAVVDSVLAATSVALTTSHDFPTIATICRASDTPRGIFYRYFDSVGSVLQVLASPYVTHVCAGASLESASASFETNTPKAAIEFMHVCSDDPLAKALFTSSYSYLSTGGVVHQSVRAVARHNAAVLGNDNPAVIHRIEATLLLLFAGMHARPMTGGPARARYDEQFLEVVTAAARAAV